jgi:hypothetical protein
MHCWAGATQTRDSSIARPTTFATCSAFPATCLAFPFFEVRQVFACPICACPDGVDLGKVGSCHKTKLVITQRFISCNWPRGVTVSTLDSESSDRGSNPREAFLCISVPANFAATIYFENSATRSHLCKACSHSTLRRQQSFYFAHCPTIKFVPAQLSRQSARRYP